MQKYKVQTYQDYDYINSQFTSLDYVMTFVTIFNLLRSSLAVSIPCYKGSFYVLLFLFLILNETLKNNNLIIYKTLKILHIHTLYSAFLII